MHFLFVTYRWHDSLVGGAELHHRRLAQELVDLGHRVTVLTSDGLEITPFCHWGVMWKSMAFEKSEGPIPVHRLPIKPLGKWQAALLAKGLQRRMEREADLLQPEFLQSLADKTLEGDGVHLLAGWHHAEVVNGEPRRWTQQRATFVVKRSGIAGTRIVVNGDLPKPQHLRLYQGDTLIGEQSFRPGFAHFAAKAVSEEPIFTLKLSRPWRPLRDFRTLGMMVNCVGSESESAGNFYADLQDDYRALGRLAPEMWQQHLLKQARERPVKYSTVIDALRGPRCRGWRAAIERIGADVTIHCNLPWGNMSQVRPGDLAMPLWHLEDDFYYWEHWISALQKTRFVLANTPYAAEKFYPGLGVKAHFVGPPIWQPEKRLTPECRGRFRALHGIAEEELLVLTVCRKSGEKRYEAIAGSVERLRGEGVPLRMIGIGPDVDQRPFQHDGCAWLGRQSSEELDAAYHACDVFALMSESESFGMVIPEAWHHGKPVVVNRACGPAASLVGVEEDGLLALPGRELDSALRRLAESRELRQRLGETGKVKAERLYVRDSAAKRLLDALAS